MDNPPQRRIKYLRAEDNFPPLEDSRSDGLLAAGGNLSTKRLLKAYGSGIFPWFDEWSPILWYSPLVRCIFEPSDFITSKSLRQRIRNGGFTVSLDSDFDAVINYCAHTHEAKSDGTWIVPAMIEAYNNLHSEGYAHSVEVWHQNKLVGGLYGVSLGKAFFGESMFHLKTDASKVALHYLCKTLSREGFYFIDAQMETSHLLSLGAYLLDRQQYIVKLQDALQHETIKGSWKNLLLND
ncbi:MAG: leucyl/phenylalanyl-tRNA--protein transferase [Lentimicrobium sp.]|nr:leucyl/phenylalanyl-tRNA--protein transferase [Lentimicrobium sp.]